MGGIAVRLNRPPHSARLVGWGRAGDGWWGCITWRQRVRTATGIDEIGFAAWVPAVALSLPPRASPVPLPRTGLPDDRRAWPAPPGWPSWFAGVWVDGPVAVPSGVELVTGPAWRDRRG